jgi:23S rRNA (cytosine1962-C5)-methyltransferase
MELLKDEVTAALTDLLRPRGIFYKNTHQFRELEGLKSYEETAFGVMPETTEIEENGLKYVIPMAGGQKTGWYFDQRENRAALAPFFKGRRVLDLHTYLGAFAITAAKAGAEIVWGVDSSEKAIEAAERNAALNGVEKTVLFRKEKAERLLEALEADQLPEKPDFILLDPPNIVRNKKYLPQALKMLSRMAGAALKALPEGGYLAVSTCSHHISRSVFMETLSDAAAKAGRAAVLVELRGQAKDHPILVSMPETEYLHFALLKVI